MRKLFWAAGLAAAITSATVTAQEPRRFFQPVEVHVGQLLLGADIPICFEGATSGTLEGCLKYYRTSLTNAQVLTLGTAAVTIVAAPGAGKVAEIIGVVFSLDYTATYSGGANLACFYGDRTTGSQACEAATASGLLTGVTADVVRRVQGAQSNTDMAANTAIVLQTVTGANFTAGNASNAFYVWALVRVQPTAL